MTHEVEPNGSQSTVESQEPIFPNPAINIKPHHYFNSYVQRALLGENPHLLAVGHITGLYHSYKYGELYYADLFGNRSTQETQELIEGVEEFYSTLGRLPEASTIRFGLTRDGICKALINGDHCLAMRYFDGSSVLANNLIDSETVYANKIVTDLLKTGSRYRRDFTRNPSVLALNDFAGKPLTESDSTPTPVVFNELIVYTDSIRKALSKRLYS